SPTLNQAGDFWYHESTYLDVQPDGRLWGRASLDGSAILYGDINLNSVIPTDYLSIFEYVNFNTWQSNSPWDDNAEINFRFQTNDPFVAEQISLFVIAIFESRLPMQMDFQGSYGFDEQRDGTWYQFTDVNFRGHVDWINMLDLINTAIPRQYGGLAATIDATNATALSFYFWLQNNNGLRIAGSIGLDFSGQMVDQAGDHGISLAEFYHVTAFVQAPWATNPLHIHVNLPDVVTKGFDFFGQPIPDVTWEYHPSPEVHNRYHVWSGWFTVDDTTTYLDIGLDFNFTFIQWSWVATDQYWLSIDPRGFESIHLQSRGKDRAAPTSNLLAGSALLQDVVSIDMWMGRDWGDTSQVRHTLNMNIRFPKGGSYLTESLAIINELETGLGIDFSINGTETCDPMVDDCRWHIGYNDTEVEVWRYNINTDITQYETKVSNMLGVQRSAMLSNTDLSEIYSINWHVFPDMWGQAAEINFNRDALRSNLHPSSIQNNYPESGFAHSADLLRPNFLGWDGSIPWNAYSEEFYAFIETPFTGSWESIQFTPGTNNGIDWDSSRWSEFHGNFEYFKYDVRVYSDTPQLTDNQGAPTGALTDLSVSWYNSFSSLTEDVETPWFNDNSVRYKNTTFPDLTFSAPNWTSAFDETTFNGTIDLVAGVTDQGDQDFLRRNYWDTGANDWKPKFPSIGIKFVDGSIFRSDAPIDHERFTFNVPFTYYSLWPGAPEWEAWLTSVDTTEYADGTWELWIDTEDNAGNHGNWPSATLEIDNYDASYNESEIIWDADAPKEGDRVRDIAQFDFTIKDDVGSFVVVAYDNLAGYIQIPVSTETNTSGTFETYSFLVDTEAQDLPENSFMAIRVEVLDMDGHWTVSDSFNVMIDNYPIGNPPIINIMTPNDGITVDNTLQSLITFEVEIIEDVEVKRANIFFEGPKTLSFLLNETALPSWTVTVDISTWSLGTYTWYIEVEDMDENTHIVQSVRFSFTLTGIEPVVVDHEDPVITDINFADGDTVSGMITFEVGVTDNIAVQEVVLKSFSNQEFSMIKHNDNLFRYDVDTAEVEDGMYTFTFTAKDTSGNQAQRSLDLNLNNGRTKSSPDVGLPGFEFLSFILATLVMIPLIRFGKKN
ncbi:MAG: hypothetical protein ACXADH_08160, partial [Candidatus Kariarchaeaceae archaeon]